MFHMLKISSFIVTLNYRFGLFVNQNIFDQDFIMHPHNIMQLQIYSRTLKLYLSLIPDISMIPFALYNLVPAGTVVQIHETDFVHHLQPSMPGGRHLLIPIALLRVRQGSLRTVCYSESHRAYHLLDEISR